jgi:hypothetical protein
MRVDFVGRVVAAHAASAVRCVGYF